MKISFGMECAGGEGKSILSSILIMLVAGIVDHHPGISIGREVATFLLSLSEEYSKNNPHSFEQICMDRRRPSCCLCINPINIIFGKESERAATKAIRGDGSETENQSERNLQKIRKIERTRLI